MADAGGTGVGSGKSNGIFANVGAKDRRVQLLVNLAAGLIAQFRL
jgi:hypothetical protein